MEKCCFIILHLHYQLAAPTDVTFTTVHYYEDKKLVKMAEVNISNWGLNQPLVCRTYSLLMLYLRQVSCFNTIFEETRWPASNKTLGLLLPHTNSKRRLVQGLHTARTIDWCSTLRELAGS